ncbi:T9SS type A sorting domain-containing protein [Reichenbachiella agarivorans]|uniref:T9SS type A sorting domain-containing protein n=1 Tax=Reichenbachiella agarivorans TaxID=2979464 RepID=A0ABY6CQE6_9BACT|nr:T9SS type A sorting domain-containing protein [Reichenbachiella agarivorans]UXP32721.1 T9SS type A sorting domain-containing protein [Reichenbachiella agarivorans]
MKYIYLTLLGVWCVTLGWTQTPVRQFLFTGGSLADNTGSGVSFSPVSNTRTLIADRAGNANSALQINNDKLTIPAVDGQSISVSFYVKTTDNLINGKMLIANRSNNYQDLGYMLTLRSGKLEFFAKMEVNYTFTNTGTPGTAPIFQNFSNIGNYRVDDGQWHHIVLVAYSYQTPGNAGYSFQIYVDGNLDSQPQLNYPYFTSQQTYQSHRIVNTSAPFEIAPYTNVNYKFTGGIDDVQYYNVALNQAQVTALYNTAPPCNVYIPDTNFKSYLLGNAAINTNGDSEIQCSEAAAFNGTIDCSSSSITSLTGIEAFTSLTELACYSNTIGSLDVSANTSLTRLSCNNNSMTSLTLGNNTALERLYCNNNQIQTLNLSQNTGLEILICHSNALSSLDVSANTAITDLRCYNNQIESLGLSTNTSLQILQCHDNGLTDLDVSANGQLTQLQCGGNEIEVLNVQNGNNTNFTVFDALTNSELTCIQVDDETYSTANWPNKPSWSTYSTDCEAFLCTVDIPDVNFKSALVATAAINTNGDSHIQCTEAAAFAGLIDVAENSISNLTGIEAFTSLTELDCTGNSLTSLDISANTALTSLWCSNNQLTSLDLSANTDLIVLSVIQNQLTALDLSHNIALTNLFCHDNALTRLNVKNGNNENMELFSANNNADLECIQVDDEAYSTANWTTIDAGASFSENCNVTPSDCISNVTVGDILSCSAVNNRYSINLTVNYTDAPTTGTLVVNGINFTVSSSPQTVSLNGTADGNSVDLEVSFSDDASCTYTAIGAWIAPDGCSDEVLGIDDEQSSLILYPNPTSDQLNIELISSASIRIVNLSGHTITIQQGNVGNNVLDVSSLAPGVYFVRSEGHLIEKFIKR